MRSELPLPELPPAAAHEPPDVDVRLGPVALGPARALTGGGELCEAPGEVRIRYPAIGAFAIREGRAITADPAPAAEPTMVRGSVLGPALAVALHQRGRLVLHASSIGLEGRALLFLGVQGAGKSTIAAALHARGHALVADDVTAVSVQPRHPTAAPGIPRFKLWPDAVERLGEVPAELPRISAALPKRERAVNGGFAASELPLGALYVLDEAPDVSVERLPGPDAVAELVRHSYCGRLLAGRPVPHLHQCAEVVGEVSAWRLARPRRLENLGAVADAIEEHARSL